MCGGAGDPAGVLSDGFKYVCVDVGVGIWVLFNANPWMDGSEDNYRVLMLAALAGLVAVGLGS